MRKIVLVLVAAFTFAGTPLSAQERYVRAEVNERGELVITTAEGKRIALGQ